MEETAMNSGGPLDPHMGKPSEQPSGAGSAPTEDVTRRAALGTGFALLGLPAVLPAAVSAQTAAQHGRLVLKHKDLAPKIKAYFKKLNGDKLAARAFVDNPTRHFLDEFVPPDHAKKVSPQRVSNANRFLYAALANAKFHKWMLNYQQQLIKSKKKPERAQAIKDLSRALVEAGSPELVLSIIEESEAGIVQQADDVVAVQDVAVVLELVAVCVAFAVALPVAVYGYPSDGGEELVIPASELRAISEQIVARAERLQKSGQLMNVYATP
jgi:hypothetical protein